MKEGDCDSGLSKAAKIRTKFRRIQMKSLLIATVAFLLTVVMSMSFVHLWKSDEEKFEDDNPIISAIRDRHAKYTNLFFDYDVDNSYTFLTPYSREKISPEEWEKKVLSSSTDHKEKVNIIRLSDNDTRAVIGITAAEGGRKGNYTQTWEFIDGEWYRAYSEDKEPKNDEISSVESEKEEEPQEKTTSFSNDPPFTLEQYSYEWKLDRNLFSRSELYLPEVTLYVRNGMWSQPIEYLQLKVDFVKGFGKELFSSVDRYVVSSGDMPLALGSRSEKIFFKSDIGLDIKDILRLRVLDDQNASKYMKRLVDYTNDIKVLIYYKLDYSSNWIQLEEYQYN